MQKLPPKKLSIIYGILWTYIELSYCFLFFFIFVPKAYAIKKNFLQRLWQIVFSLNKN